MKRKIESPSRVNSYVHTVYIDKRSISHMKHSSIIYIENFQQYIFIYSTCVFRALLNINTKIRDVGQFPCFTFEMT